MGTRDWLTVAAYAIGFAVLAFVFLMLLWLVSP